MAVSSRSSVGRRWASGVYATLEAIACAVGGPVTARGGAATSPLAANGALALLRRAAASPATRRRPSLVTAIAASSDELSAVLLWGGV